MILIIAVLFCRLVVSLDPLPMNNIDVVMIIDQKTMKGAITAVHSIVKSSGVANRLVFNFLVLDESAAEGVITEDTRGRVATSVSSAGTTASLLQQWESNLSGCLSGIRSRNRQWRRPATYPHEAIQNKQFDSDYIYARFYIPFFFPELIRFVYVDNDIVFNGDIRELYQHPLISIASKLLQRQIPKTNIGRPGRRHSPGEERQLPVSVPLLPPREDSAVGFVAEKASFYKDYIERGFNMSHPIVRSALGQISVNLTAC